MTTLTVNQMEQLEGGIEQERICTVGLSAIITLAAPTIGIPVAGWGAFGAALCIGIISDLACRGWWD